MNWTVTTNGSINGSRRTTESFPCLQGNHKSSCNRPPKMIPRQHIRPSLHDACNIQGFHTWKLKTDTQFKHVEDYQWQHLEARLTSAELHATPVPRRLPRVTYTCIHTVSALQDKATARTETSKYIPPMQGKLQEQKLAWHQWYLIPWSGRNN